MTEKDGEVTIYTVPSRIQKVVYKFRFEYR